MQVQLLINVFVLVVLLDDEAHSLDFFVLAQLVELCHFGAIGVTSWVQLHCSGLTLCCILQVLDKIEAGAIDVVD